MSFIGSWKVDDLLTFVVNTQVFATGVATDADSVPTYRVYEDETGTPILTGSMALLDSANTAGFYSEQITLSAANGFEKGKCYAIYIAATVSSVAGATHRTFQMEADVEANSISATALAALADAVWDEAVDGATTGRQSIRLANSANGAKLSGAATTTVVIRDLADSKDRVTATVDADGNRSAITRDLT